MLWATASVIRTALDGAAWQLLLAEPQLIKSLALTLWTGLAASALSLGATAWLLSRSFPGPRWTRLVRWLGPLLAVPHVSFAIGFAFLISPSGWLLRALSPWATGFDEPPPWPTTQDPWGLGLIAVLVFKEVPFLLWAAATQLQRSDVALRWTRELQVAHTLGYSGQAAWWRVLWPQLWPRLRWPLLAVLAYSLTVVDMALVIGPASPPTLAVLAWQWLLDADAAVNAQGAVAGWLLALVVGMMALPLWQLPRAAFWHGRQTRGTRGRQGPGEAAVAAARVWQLPHPLFAATAALWLAVLLALAVGSVSGVWAFPALWPQSLSLQAWASVAGSTHTLTTSFTLALASAATALLWSVAWLECAPPRWDAVLRRAVYLPLLLPSVLWVVGLHGLTLAWGLDAHWSGLWLAHNLASVPYALIALSPAYIGFDARYAQIAATLGRRRLAFLLGVKWPLLRAALASAFAVGFAVSVAQYLPTVFVGAGRYTTVTTEAVTLASGAQRSLTAAYAWLQWLLPVAVFALAAWVGLPRRFARSAT
ncbi:MAG: ABC transporter permease [Bdellovibrionales bacterium]|nr:ABC transporter permease [Ramlibacter sp.]